MNNKEKSKNKTLKNMKRQWRLYILMLPAILYVALFNYKPMYGILIAFKDFRIKRGVWGSDWVGLDHFERLFSSYWFPYILKNTFVISVLGLLIGFPLAIILALLLNELKNKKFRSAVQTISYAPYFISTVVMCGMITMFLSPTSGVINRVLNMLGMESVYFLQSTSMFKWIYEISNVWQMVGWNSIIYFAALSSVDQAILEAADIDGASRLKKIWYINIPEIIPTIVVMFVLRCGQILSLGYEKIFLLQNDMNLLGSEVISTYVYRVGLEQSDFAFSTAVGLFNTVVNCVFLIVANALSKKLTESSLF